MSFPPEIGRFKGLNNVSDPLRLKLGWLSAADNIDVTNTGAIETRQGYQRTDVTPTSAAFQTRDLRAYVVADGAIQRLTGVGLTSIIDLTGSGRMYWTEINRDVYFNNGVDRGIIHVDDTVSQWGWATPGSVRLGAVSGSLPGGTYQALCTFLLPDGRETGASTASAVVLDGTQALQVTDIPQVPGYTTLLYIAPADSSVFQLYGPAPAAVTWNSGPEALGTNLSTQFLDPLPLGTEVVQHWKGRVYASQYLAADNISVVWMTEPLGYHLFNLNSGFFMVPGQVRMLASVDQALIVGTDAEIYAYDGESLASLAPYGTPPGWPWAYDEDTKTVLIWTNRGVCRALPFENITQEYVSVPPGLQVGASIVRRDGHKKFVANLVAGGTAFNQRL